MKSKSHRSPRNPRNKLAPLSLSLSLSLSSFCRERRLEIFKIFLWRPKSIEERERERVVLQGGQRGVPVSAAVMAMEKGFIDRAANALDSIDGEGESGDLADKSRKGSVDEPIRELVSDINELGKNLVFTTSSCSGRVSLVAEASKGKRSKGDAKWVFMSHDPVVGSYIVKAVDDYVRDYCEEEETLTFRFEPFILALECASLDVAKEMIKVGREAGCRESGMHLGQRYIVSIRCSIRLELPVIRNGKLLVPKEYLHEIADLSSEKFEDNFRRIGRFHSIMKTKLMKLSGAAAAGGAPPQGSLETKPDCVWAVQIDKRRAKALKDMLKSRNWLVSKKILKPTYSEGKIAFPLTKSGQSNFPFRKSDLDASIDPESLILIKLDEETNARDPEKKSSSPYEELKKAVSAFLSKQNLAGDLVERLVLELPHRWERLGDALLIPNKYMRNKYWHEEGMDALWEVIAASLKCKKIGRQREVQNNDIRESGATLIWPSGGDGLVKHLENGILYCFDFTKCMFSSGNVTEKARVAAFDCRDEVVLDMFAGIGYFTLPYLCKAGAKYVYACEWNPEAAGALRENLKQNDVQDRCTVLEGDCTINAPAGIAHRVNLGLIPSSEIAWPAAVRALVPQGGWLHIHTNCFDSEIAMWAEGMLERLRLLAREQGRDGCNFHVRHIEKVKWYAPKVRHIVVDVQCTLDTAGTSAPSRKVLPCSHPFDPARNLGVLEGTEEIQLAKHISSSRKPLLFRGLDVGQDNWLWTREGLMSLDPSGSMGVSVHVSDSPALDFVNKNFKYSKMSFLDMIKATDQENLYLRCLGQDPRKEPADLNKSFPALGEAFKMPQVVDDENVFSTVLRVASNDLMLWTHYDIMDNLLIQMTGKKRVLLFPPECRKDLYISGSSSPIIDVDDKKVLEAYPEYRNARAKALEILMEPGDILFIPALWFHSVKSRGFSVAVNTFFRHLPSEYYERKDVYGNKDLKPFQDALVHLKRVKELQSDYRKFYVEQLLEFLQAE